MRKFLITLLAFLLIAAVAVACPPAQLTDVTPNSATLRGLDCRTPYPIRIQERRSGLWGNLSQHTPTTAACTPTLPPDREDDGVPDSQGQCPDERGLASNNGCPRPPPPPVGCQSSGEPGPIAGRGYSLRFFDCFDTLNRSVWDDHVWYAEAPNAGWNGFQEVDKKGVLHLRTSRNFSCGRGCSYPINTITTQTSGRTFRQGYFEARMKWTKGNGAWPAFWLLSYRHATNPSWPSVNPACAQRGEPVAHCYAGEVDVFEGQGSEPNVFYGTIHRNSCDCYGVSDSQRSNNRQPIMADLTAGFHTYAMLWTVTSVTWYLDGQPLYTTPVYDSTDQPMFLVFSMARGGWTRPIDSTTPDVIETKVDWIRVWQR